MANAREILSRIKSIKDTKKITNAMYMVSSSKLQKAKKDLQNTEPYFLEIQESMAKILNFAPEVGSKFFDQREHKKGADRRIGYLVITLQVRIIIMLSDWRKKLLLMKRMICSSL